jgi:hypothetical protein
VFLSGRSSAVGTAILAFFALVGNNLLGTVMRLACGLAIALSLLPGGMVGAQQDSASPANTDKQAPASPASTPTAPPGQTPEAATPAATVLPQNASAHKKTANSAVAKRRKRTAPTPSPSEPRKIVVREGGATEPSAQIIPGITPAEAARQYRDAQNWLASADNELKQLEARTLNAQQQETVGQIHNYMEGARSALKEGDVGRASTLAQKAHLLSEDIVKH